MTLLDALTQAAAAGLDRLDAQMLVLHALGRSPHDRAWLIAHDSDPLPCDAAALWDALVQRRQAGEPVAYLLGRREFAGLTLAVDSRVLVPRPDTEVLLEWALDVLPPPGSTARLLDLGTGSGAIALGVASRRPDAQVTATDASSDALAVAQANARRLDLPVRFLQGSWLAAVPGERFQVIVSNPPYIAEGDPHLDALGHEPRLALTAGADGLDDLRRIIASAPDHLMTGGWLLLEHGFDQATAVRGLLRDAGLGAVNSRTDLAGIERCSGGQLPRHR
ncbi:MAG TPA: peptide chain release factor N(5)-glutamine methyltransferase [Hydrogenophaga sp.]|uniref:peptide chain release factor N(5)-glutamine methyltransferase n=1 Tax=Hydrogenophaga sp. TaxID=1904254 RepID=UPI002CFA79E2|nr:peptide chain release factor N(5)-glutamine methyltransferase [Hydrogenophaga sp.]HMN92543.1 peptide chain release factor N(5)-glutamine methyltransferase [Hydrogenophaga sp.]HMP11141.1 peptide chain release factor N(5)-glutamine methyltransferase [Hydrogenophaga sp.]